MRISEKLRTLAIALPYALVWLYRVSLSKILPPTCRFKPSCSHYALQALTGRGLLAGLLLIFYRLLRCNPFCASGYDPVPPKGWPAKVMPWASAPEFTEPQAASEATCCDPGAKPESSE
mgnify:CR=1 FL=1